jgi:hypothetical protein
MGSAAPAVVHAQLAANATIESQYRFRGVELTNGKPDLRLGLSYDSPSGVYAGVSGIGEETVSAGVRALGYVAYVGFAKRTRGGLTWDVGATNSEINLFLPLRAPASSTFAGNYTTSGNGTSSAPEYFHYRANYTEVYGGVSWKTTSVHLYISPDYLGQSVRTAYLDVTETFRPMTHLRLYGHAGALTPLAGGSGSSNDREHVDLGAGAAWEFRHGEVQLAWTMVTPQVQYPIGYPQTRNALVLSISGFF